MNTYADKKQNETSRSISNALPKKQSASEHLYQFVDNRLEAARQSELQRIADDRSNIMQLKVNQVAQLAITDPTESGRVDDWVANANNILGNMSPDSVVEAAPSRAIRLRWYDVTIHGNSYLVGVNIHYGGAFGALWVKNNATQETNTYHPHAPPQHGLNPATLAKLQLHVYEFDTVLHYKATHPEPPDGDWDRQFSGA
jgi:hypothetical protein